jgi:hypothetical protein
LLEENRKLADIFLECSSTNNENNPWEILDSGVNKKYLKRELEKSDQSLRTKPCTDNCKVCGVCNKEIKITKNDSFVSVNDINIDKALPCDSLVNHYLNMVNVVKSKNICDPGIYRILFSFAKKESAVFHGHLSLVDIFSMSFRRAGIPVIYTKGFNPLAKMEFASPLSTGVKADNEIAAVDFEGEIPVDKFITRLNKNLPQGIYIENAQIFSIPEGVKKRSLASLLWGFAYKGVDGNTDYINVSDEKAYRQTRLQGDCKSLLDLNRKAVLAKNIYDNETEWKTYFEIYEHLYK